MTLKEFYEYIGGDYDGVVSRLMNETLVMRFVLKFLEDGSFDLLCKSLDEGNNEEAFRAAHTIKGIAQNLSFTKLYEYDCILTDELRDGGSANMDTFEKVKRECLRTIGAVERLKSNNE